MDTKDNAQSPDGYYGDEDMGKDELDLSFLDDDESEDTESTSKDDKTNE